MGTAMRVSPVHPGYLATRIDSAFAVTPLPHPCAVTPARVLTWFTSAVAAARFPCSTFASAHRPIHPRVEGIVDRRHVEGVSRVPRRVRHRLGQAVGVHHE